MRVLEPSVMLARLDVVRESPQHGARMIDHQPGVADFGVEHHPGVLALVAEEAGRPADQHRAVQLAGPCAEFFGEGLLVEADMVVLDVQHAGERVVAALERASSTNTGDRSP